MKYVRETCIAGWTATEAFLWHAARDDGDGWLKTACGRSVRAGEDVIGHAMTLREWGERFGEDVDLCECAVDAPADAARVQELMREAP